MSVTVNPRCKPFTECTLRRLASSHCASLLFQTLRVVDRKIPDHFTQADRNAFLQIASAPHRKSKLHTIASLGMQSFVCARDVIEVSK